MATGAGRGVLVLGDYGGSMYLSDREKRFGVQLGGSSTVFMTSRWASNLFKGRIGEAVVEAVLQEFGYKVTRGGFELASANNARYAPDLVVERQGQRRLVEVKFQSARPTAVQLDIRRVQEYKKHYPGTIVTMCSAWNGAIFCAKVEDIPLERDDGLITLSLLDDYWQPITYFFSLVQKGERLQRLWGELKKTLSGFGARQISSRKVNKLWDSEYEDLSWYLTNTWTEDLQSLGIEEPQTDRMTLEELWQRAREINAISLIEELLDPSEKQPIDSNLMLLAKLRALGESGESHLSIHIPSLAADLGLDGDNPTLLLVTLLLSGILRSHEDPRLGEIASSIVGMIPDGAGEAYLLDPTVPFEQSERVDLKTALRLFITPCRIDR